MTYKFTFRFIWLNNSHMKYYLLCTYHGPDTEFGVEDPAKKKLNSLLSWSSHSKREKEIIIHISNMPGGVVDIKNHKTKSSVRSKGKQRETA